MGTRSDPRPAASLARIDAARLPDAIDALVVGHVLSDGDGVRAGKELRFAHPVVREAVLAELGPGERAALHAAAAVALHAAGAPVDRVAAHLASGRAISKGRATSCESPRVRRARCPSVPTALPGWHRRRPERIVLEARRSPSMGRRWRSRSCAPTSTTWPQETARALATLCSYLPE